ncbi:fructosamine kinase family protein [Ekhidna sp.]|uniref:fructosamine kinase family protein n=1 Tax=Ekhidna sp. TaxID=2608089 RepID=UPI003C7B391E
MSDFIQKVISNKLKTSLISYHSIAGGCINNAFQVKTDSGDYFLKWNKSPLLDMFRVEKKGLAILNAHSPVHSPSVISFGEMGGKSYLITEWINKGSQNDQFWENFGRNLALQHQVTMDQFGLDHDNFIGSLPQSNKQHQSWYSFFINERLKPQMNMASSKGLIDTNIQKKFDLLFQQFEELIPDEPPALLHGDLWSGNFMINSEGEASIFDPAVHFGHRETELAFTQLFGGFSPKFYHYYNEQYPLEPGFDERIDLHNLYPLLVHVNLFGSSYLSGIVQTLKKFT